MPHRILVVEDSATQRKQLQELLQRAGYEVEVAEDGLTALEKLRGRHPNLILSDVVMPGLDGFDLCGAVKSSEATRHIPFVILTMLNSPVDVVIGLERGADNFITKPVEEAHLLGRVQCILENTQRAEGQSGASGGLVKVGDRLIPVSAGKEQIVELLVAIIEDLKQVNGKLVQSERLLEEYRMRLDRVKRIHDALSEDKFVLHAQPMMDLKDRHVSHYELLLRMTGDDGEIVPPGEFLPAAEHSGLIREIDHWVMRRALDLHLEWAALNPHLHLAFNLSATCFADPECLPLLKEEATRKGVELSKILVEITETAVIANMDEATQFMEEVQKMGCRFAIDDFGVGFTTFDVLKRLPVDFVKIDGSFVRELPSSQVDQHLVKAMVEAVHGLGMQTIAEFVGDEETVLLLRDYGVDYAQGFYIGRPQPLDAVAADLRDLKV